MRARMVSVGTVAGPLRRAVRDIARASGKRVRWELDGEDTELDRHVLEQLREPLVALVRNAADHGVEPPGERAERGKPEEAVVRVQAGQVGADVVIAVSDDGRGIDVDRRQRQRRPAAERRRRARRDLRARPQHGGARERRVRPRRRARRGALGRRRAARPGRGAHAARARGTEFRIRVPMTLAVVRCLLVAHRRPRATPSRCTPPPRRCPAPAERGDPARRAATRCASTARRSASPTSRTSSARPARGGAAAAGPPWCSRPRRDGTRSAWTSCRPARRRGQGPRPLPPPPPARWPAPASSPTAGSCSSSTRTGSSRPPAPRRSTGPAGAPPSRPRRPRPPGCSWSTTRSPSASSSDRSSSAPGTRSSTAADGPPRCRRSPQRPADLVLTDVEMPGMDGFALAAAIRAAPELASMPVVILTSRGDDAGPRAAASRRARTPTWSSRTFDAATLLGRVRRLLGRVSVTAAPLRLVLVEDSATQRAHLARVLQAGGDIVVVAEVADADAAVAAVARHRPDVVTMDLDLPGSGGQDGIARIMAETPTPILVLSGLIDGVGAARAVVGARRRAPSTRCPSPRAGTRTPSGMLRRQVRTVASVPVVGRRRRRVAEPAVQPAARAGRRGGNRRLDRGTGRARGAAARAAAAPRAHPARPAHPSRLHRGFVHWLNAEVPAPVEMRDARRAGAARPRLRGAGRGAPAARPPRPAGARPGPRRRPPAVRRRALRVDRRPSRAAPGIGVSLTGMGDDGARGLLAMRRAGARTFAQDEASSVVFGMPRAAHRLGAVQRLLPPEQIAKAVPRAGTRRDASAALDRPGCVTGLDAALERAAELLADHIGLRVEGSMRGRVARALRDGAAARGESPAAYVPVAARAQPDALQALSTPSPCRRRASSATPPTSRCWSAARCPRCPPAGVVWSVGCAHGQEAVVARHGARGGRAREDWRVLATDVSARPPWPARRRGATPSARWRASPPGGARASCGAAARAAGRSGRGCAAACSSAPTTWPRIRRPARPAPATSSSAATS